ncbi:MAG: hypothetical protein RLZZ457_117 [Pseudomonadota bacterium]
MFIPDVINTLLMGLIFMVIVVTVIRPFVLHMFAGPMNTEDMQKAAIEAVQYEMMRAAELAEAQRGDKIRFQQLLLQLPEKPKPKPQPVVVPEPEVSPEPVAEEAPAEAAQALDANGMPLPATGDVADAEAGVAGADGVTDEANAEAAEDDDLVPGEIEIREGESLAEIKERIKKEQQKAKKPTIPPELLNNANSYEDKVGVVRMVVQTDQNRVAAVIRSMIEIK